MRSAQMKLAPGIAGIKMQLNKHKAGLPKTIGYDSYRKQSYSE